MMIIRNIFLRQGTLSPIAYKKSLLTKFPGHRIATSPPRQWTRCLATEVDLESIESSLDNSLKETKSIESEIQKQTNKLVPQIDSETHASLNLLKDGTAQEYTQLQRHSTGALSIIGLQMTECFHRKTHKCSRLEHRPSLPTTHSRHQASIPLRHNPRAPPRLSSPPRPQDLPLASHELALHLRHTSRHPHHLFRGHSSTPPPRLSCCLRRC